MKEESGRQGVRWLEGEKAWKEDDGEKMKENVWMRMVEDGQKIEEDRGRWWMEKDEEDEGRMEENGKMDGEQKDVGQC